ncbi:hypothetical protein Tco_0455776 [Tanacetum coccineum]
MARWTTPVRGGAPFHGWHPYGLICVGIWGMISVESIRWPTVGGYKVDVASFESLALPELQSNKPLSATIPVPKGGRDIPAVARLKNHPGATVFTLTTSNRDAMKDQVYSQITEKLV